jgi:hypothetical protein
MTFNLPQILGALALLWMPLPFSLRDGKLGLYHERVESATLLGLVKAWQNWADLVRSCAGAWLLVGYAFNTSGPSAHASPVATYLQIGVLLLGVLVQTVRLGGEVNLFAPLFYLTGLTFVLGGYREGGFAVACGWAMAIGTRDFRYLLPTLVVMLAGAAMIYQALHPIVIAGLVFALLPTAFAALFQKRLWFLARERKRSGRRVMARIAAGQPALETAAARRGRRSKTLTASVQRTD